MEGLPADELVTLKKAWSHCCRQLTRLKRLLDPGGYKPKIPWDACVWNFISTRDDIESVLVALGVAASRAVAREEEIVQVTESERALFIAAGEFDALVEKGSRFRPCPLLAWAARKSARRLSAITSHPGDAYWVDLGMELAARSRFLAEYHVASKYRSPPCLFSARTNLRGTSDPCLDDLPNG